MLEALGAELLSISRSVGSAMVMLVSAMAGMRYGAGRGSEYFRHTLYQQLYFSALQPLVLIVFAGFVLGILAVLPLHRFAVHSSMVQVSILDAVLFHQIIPFVVAMVVIGRSGTAITAELGDMQAHDVEHGLLAMGIEPNAFIVLPRLLALMAALLILTLWGNVGAVVGVGIINTAYGTGNLWQVVEAAATVIKPLDLVITMVMVASYGAAIGIIHCHLGWEGRTSVETERNLPRAFVRSFMACILMTVLFGLVRP